MRVMTMRFETNEFFHANLLEDGMLEIEVQVPEMSTDDYEHVRALNKMYGHAFAFALEDLIYESVIFEAMRNHRRD